MQNFKVLQQCYSNKYVVLINYSPDFPVDPFKGDLSLYFPIFFLYLV